MILRWVFSGLFSMETGKMKSTYITLRYLSHTAPCLEMFHIHVHKSNSFHMTCRQELSALSFGQKKDFPGRKIARGDEMLLEWKNNFMSFS